MLNAFLYNRQKNELKSLDGMALMESRPTENDNNGHNGHSAGALGNGPAQCRHGELIWVDITDPTEDDFALLEQRFNLHPMVMEDIREHEGRPKLHDYGDYLYVVFHAVKMGETPEDTEDFRFELDLCEIDCLVGRDYIVSLHQCPVASFDELRTRWQKHPELMRPGPGILLYEMMDGVLDDYFPVLDAIDDRIDQFEDHLFTAFTERLSGDIFTLKRSLVRMRQIAGPMRDVANSLLRHNADHGGKHFVYFQDLYDHASRIVDMIDTFREILSGALDAYLALESNRMNDIMKKLTAASIILLIPTLIAGVYGMNFDDLPKQHGFYGSLMAMAIIVVGLLLYFKRRRWI